MARSKGDGERLPLKRFHYYDVRNGEDDWRKIEKVAGITLTSEVRKKIHCFTTLYSKFGPLYSPKRSVLAKDAQRAIASWSSVTERLVKTLTPSGTDLAEFIRVDNKIFSRMSKLTSIGQVALIGLLAESVSQKALNSLRKENRNGRIEQDQWAAWICLVTKELRTAGLKITGKSLDKSNGESSYVRVMLIFQSWLPGECRHCNSYESMRKGARAADKKFGRSRKITLLQIIAGWGSQLLLGYPGNLRQMPEEEFATFDDFAERIRAQAELRVSKARTSSAD